MGQFLQTNGDYNIKTKEGGVVRLDVGPPSSGGQVIVTSDLIVEGDTLTVEAENLNVKDNIIQLNFGETGAGVSLRYAGLQIDRGSLNPGSFFWDENDDSFNLATGSPETTFNYNSTLRLKKITTDSSNPDLELIGYGNGVITVTGTADYENQITDDDDIPNKKYVDDSIRDNPTFQIIDDNTRVIVTDKEVTGSLQYLIDNTGYSSYSESAVSVLIDNTLNTQFYANRALVQGFEFNQNEPGSPTITVNNTNDSIFLQTNGTGKVILDGLSHPTADGTAGQFLKTDGSANLPTSIQIDPSVTDIYQFTGKNGSVSQNQGDRIIDLFWSIISGNESGNFNITANGILQAIGDNITGIFNLTIQLKDGGGASDTHSLNVTSDIIPNLTFINDGFWCTPTASITLSTGNGSSSGFYWTSSVDNAQVNEPYTRAINSSLQLPAILSGYDTRSQTAQQSGCSMFTFSNTNNLIKNLNKTYT